MIGSEQDDLTVRAVRGEMWPVAPNGGYAELVSKNRDGAFRYTYGDKSLFIHDFFRSGNGLL